MSDEEKKAWDRVIIMKNFICCDSDDDYENNEAIKDIEAIDTILKLVEKQQKEIEELKEENKKYIVQLTDEQYRKLVDIIRDETGKEWENKIKAKIEEYEEKIKKIKEKDVWEEPYDTEKYVRYTNYISVLQSLLEKE